MTPEQRILAIARRETEALAEKIEEFQEREYPTVGPKALAEILLRLNSKIIQTIDEKSCHPTVIGLKDVVKQSVLTRPLHFLGLLHMALQFLDKTELRDNPYGLIPPMQDILRHIYADCNILLRPQWDYMYGCIDIVGTLRERTRAIWEDDEEISLKLQMPCPVFSYPASHRRLLLLQAVQCHEIGHFFDKICGVSADAFAEVTATRQLLNLADSLAKEALREEETPRTLDLDISYYVRLRRIQSAYRNILCRMLKDWLAELVSDFFALRVFGPAYFFAVLNFSEILGPLQRKWTAKYPRPCFRLKLILQELTGEHGYYASLDEATRRVTDDWQRVLDEMDTATSPDPIQSTLEDAIEIVKEGLKGRIRSETEGYAFSASLLEDGGDIERLLDLIENMVPPIMLIQEDHAETKFVEPVAILNAGWVFYLTRMSQLEAKLDFVSANREREAERIFNNLIWKAIEVSELCRRSRCSKELPSDLKTVQRLVTEKPEKRICVTPLLSVKSQLHHFSIDIRLASEFLVPLKTKYPALDPYPRGGFSVAEIEQYQERVYVAYGSYFVLHPHQFVLGSTFEYIKLPLDISAYVVGRSSLGRLGLTIATATAVAPGFCGCLTLELANIGETPILLYPGMRIGQLVFSEQEPAKRGYLRGPSAKYVAPVSPEFSRIRQDSDWEDLESSGYLKPFDRTERRET